MNYELSPEVVERLSRKGIDPKNLAEILAKITEAPIPAQLPGFEENKAGGSLPNKGRASQGAAPRLSRSQLTELLMMLTERNRHILTALYKYRFLLTSQVQRLYFNEPARPGEEKTEEELTRRNTINANRILNKLESQGLVTHLPRRSFGYRKGTPSMVWHLTSAGYRLLALMNPDKYSRKSFDEPSTMFLAHTLAIAETAVQLSTICAASGDISLKTADPEPSCWRPFNDNGRQVFLKPDLYAVTVTDYGYDEKYETSWFIEMDLGTEGRAQIVEKCRAYLRYYNTGIEQQMKDVFPVVVWLVKDEDRKQRLRQYIKDSLPSQPKLFLVITPDQLGKLVRNFIEPAELC